MPARLGEVRRALMPPKDRFWCPIDRQKKGVDSPESKTQNDPLRASGHAAPPPNAHRHHMQPLCGCSKAESSKIGPLGVELAQIAPQCPQTPIKAKYGPFRPLMDRNEGIWVQNIHKGVAYDVSAHSGGVRRALMPPGGHFGCPPGPPKQARFGRDQAVGWGTYLAQNGTARHPNCTGRLIGTLCAYSGGWAHQNYQSWWSLGH